VGAAVALTLAAAGASIYLIGRRFSRLELVAAKARDREVNAAFYSADISTSSGQLCAAQRVKADVMHVDILVQNAAMYAAPFEDADLSDFDRQYQTNVRAPYALTQALLPILKARHGQVVFINSNSALAAKPMSAQYDSTLKAIADSLRAEINVHGVQVLSVYLGRAASEMQERIMSVAGSSGRDSTVR
jgi:short-subunit dehydrogenase